MMAVRYHGCTCHLRYSNSNSNAKTEDSTETNADNSSKNSSENSSEKEGENKSQPWYFHVVASVILVVHGLTFLVPHDPETEDTDMMRIIGRWFGFDWEWMKHLTPYAQVSF